MTRRRVASLAVSATIALVVPAHGAGADANGSAYRSHVNAICRANTPKFKRAEADMLRAQRAGNQHRFGYDLGFILGLSLRQGVTIERTPVPGDARSQMAKPLRLLHRVDLQLRRVLARVQARDPGGFEVELLNLEQIGKPLNHAFDSVGLRDCGSNQQ